MVVGSHAVIEGRDGLRIGGQSLPHLRRGAGQGSLLPLGPPFLTFQIVLLPDKLKTCSHVPRYQTTHATGKFIIAYKHSVKSRIQPTGLLRPCSVVA